MLKSGLTTSIFILLAAACSQESGFSGGNARASKQLADDDLENSSGFEQDYTEREEIAIESLEDVQQTCAGRTKSVTKRISFPDNNAECPWGRDDNDKGKRRNGRKNRAS